MCIRDRVEADGEQDPEGWAQWSRDRGRTWHALGAGLRPGSSVLDARGLPAGRVVVRLLVSDGYHTTNSRQIAVTVPRRPPDASILSPREQQTFVAGSPMRLWGAAHDATGAPVRDEEVRWQVDDRDVAHGTDAFVEAPEPGEHRATLLVKSRDGSTEVAVTFLTIEMPEDRDQD